MQSTLVLLALSLNLVLFIADPNAADGACPSPEHPDWTTECPDGKCGPPGWLCCPSFKTLPSAATKIRLALFHLQTWQRREFPHALLLRKTRDQMLLIKSVVRLASCLGA